MASRVVELSPHHLKVEGLSQASRTGTNSEKMAKSCILTSPEKVAQWLNTRLIISWLSVRIQPSALTQEVNKWQKAVF
jgi:hypothetical protein